MALTLKIKRIYELPKKTDGFRILVDRLWPRGIKKQSAKIDLWLKDIAPSTALRQWYAHDPTKWSEFKKRYHQELKNKKDIWQPILHSPKRTVTLLFAAKDIEHSHALALQIFLLKKLKS